ncbi:MAG: hypothetical protein JWM17_911 [Actinobacteria bacterium]|nr:hypothetical protein [Actinomycetota bacterium]
MGCLAARYRRYQPAESGAFEAPEARSNPKSHGEAHGFLHPMQLITFHPQ